MKKFNKFDVSFRAMQLAQDAIIDAMSVQTDARVIRNLSFVMNVLDKLYHERVSNLPYKTHISTNGIN